VNVGIRAGSDAEAASGPAALATLVDDLLAELPPCSPRASRRSGADPLAGLVPHRSRLSGHPEDGDRRPLRRPGRERRLRHRSSPRVLAPVLDLLTGSPYAATGQRPVVRT
jgi:hypothetical protein